MASIILSFICKRPTGQDFKIDPANIKMTKAGRIMKYPAGGAVGIVITAYHLDVFAQQWPFGWLGEVFS